MSPFASLIMPTRGRPELAAIALDCVLAQDYAQTPDGMEIVIFDDEDLPSFSDPPAGRTRRESTQCPPVDVRYFRNPRSTFRTLGDKRNAMCEESRGEIIAHIDSDDLSAPARLSTQVQILLQCRADISGFHTLPFYDIATGKAYLYYLNSACVCGTSLVYRKDFWCTHPFPSADIGEDLPYTSGNRQHRAVSSGRDMLVALLHADNMSSSRQVRNHPAIFPQISTGSLPEWFRERAKESNWPGAAVCGSVVERYQTATL